MYTFHSNPLPDGSRVTVVAEFDTDRNELELAFARCSKKDQFSRKLGRQIAGGRLAKGHIGGVIAGLKGAPKYKEFSNRISKYVEENHRDICARITIA